MPTNYSATFIEEKSKASHLAATQVLVVISIINLTEFFKLIYFLSFIF